MPEKENLTIQKTILFGLKKLLEADPWKTNTAGEPKELWIRTL